MATGLIDIIKRATLDVIHNAQMADLRFGTVISTSPLKVQITQQFTIPESLLIVPQHLTDYTVKVSLKWETLEAGEHSHPAPVSIGVNGNHKHIVESNKDKSLTIHNSLKVGDKVALLRSTGGQTYYILDRI